MTMTFLNKKKIYPSDHTQGKKQHTQQKTKGSSESGKFTDAPGMEYLYV